MVNHVSNLSAFCQVPEVDRYIPEPVDIEDCVIFNTSTVEVKVPAVWVSVLESVSTVPACVNVPQAPFCVDCLSRVSIL